MTSIARKRSEIVVIWQHFWRFWSYIILRMRRNVASVQKSDTTIQHKRDGYYFVDLDTFVYHLYLHMRRNGGSHTSGPKSLPSFSAAWIWWKRIEILAIWQTSVRRTGGIQRASWLCKNWLTMVSSLAVAQLSPARHCQGMLLNRPPWLANPIRNHGKRQSVTESWT